MGRERAARASDSVTFSLIWMNVGPMKTPLKINRQLLDDLVDLVVTNRRRVPLFRKSSFSKMGIRKQMETHILKALSCGVFEYKYHRNKLVAFLLLNRVELAPGLPVFMGTVNATENKVAKDWVFERLENLKFLFNSSTQIILPVHLRSMLPQLSELGFNIDTVRLMGSVPKCIEKLQYSEDPTELFRRHRLSLHTATAEDLEQVREIERREFSRCPEYGWFVSEKAWLDNMLNARLDSLKDDTIKCHVLKSKSGKVKGYFGSFNQADPSFGMVGGPELIFDRSIQGKGLSKPAYQIILQDLLKGKAKYLSGNTSQVGVLKHAQTMGRVPVSYFLRFHPGYFDRDHFFKNI
ncbi:MAG: hypothetical protein CL677_02490 [Bdellovibrionaceae bacterium]|nr:hypothetical protein [Pseudobdellovibrionaceae bacterium]|tara:strand:- start:4435 stop:5487 length:1053 start_codon:yes stop_codon:yes gene_type:complete